MSITINPSASGGGKSQSDFFLVKINSGKTGYDFIQPDSIQAAGGDQATVLAYLAAPTVLGTPTRANALLYSLQYLEDTKPVSNDKGEMSIDFGNLEDTPELNDYLVVLAIPTPNTGGLPEKTLENGVKIGGTSDATKQLLVVSYTQTSGTKLKTECHVCNLDVTSGGHQSKYGDYSNVVMKTKGILTEADLVIPAAIFDAALVTGASTTIPEGAGFTRKYMTSA